MCPLIHFLIASQLTGRPIWGVVVDFYYRLPEQKEGIDEAFFIQLEETLFLQTLALTGDFNHPAVRSTTDVNSLDCSDGVVRDPESRVQGKKQDHYP